MNNTIEQKLIKVNKVSLNNTNMDLDYLKNKLDDILANPSQLNSLGWKRFPCITLAANIKNYDNCIAYLQETIQDVERKRKQAYDDLFGKSMYFNNSVDSRDVHDETDQNDQTNNTAQDRAEDRAEEGVVKDTGVQTADTEVQAEVDKALSECTDTFDDMIDTEYYGNFDTLPPIILIYMSLFILFLHSLRLLFLVINCSS
jgi:hypothetical protein